jgi:exodeoxyribonuclease VII small subunit
VGDRSGAPTPPQADPAAEAALEALSFEQALERLEALVAQLEQGDLELEEALAAFERGVALARRCSGRLEQAERRVEMLVREGGRLVARPLEEPEGEA